LMELMQYLFLPNRYFEYGDMLANLIGSFFWITNNPNVLFKY